MKYAISSGARHLVGRLDRGDKTDDFIEALEEVCNKEHIRAGFFSAVGALSSAELQLYAAETRDYTTCFEVRHDPRHALEVVSLTGHISSVGSRSIVRAHASLAYLSLGGQVHVVGGLLRRSRVLMCEYCITFFQDVQMQCKRVQGTDVPMIDFNTVGGRGASGRDLLPEPAADIASAPAAAPWHVAEPRRIPEVFAVGGRTSQPHADEASAPAPAPASPAPASPAPVSPALVDPPSAVASAPAPEPADVVPTNLAPAAQPVAAQPEAVEPVVASPAPAPADAWLAAVAQANAPEPAPPAPAPRMGDLLRHPRLGDCLVIGFEGAGRVAIAQPLESQATHRVSLDEFLVRLVSREGERVRFKLKPLPPVAATATANAAPLPPDNGMGLRVRPRTGRGRLAEEELEQFPTTQDLVEHPKWGLCQVSSADEDKDTVHLRPQQGANASTREVSLKHFNIVYARHEGAQKVLRLEPRDKRGR